MDRSLMVSPDNAGGFDDTDDDGIPNYQDDDSGTPVVGDINGDGEIDALDVQLVVNGALGLSIR